MLKSVASRVAWAGRAASVVFGLALILALMVGAASTAWSATGMNLILGKPNAAETPTSLVATLADAAKPALTVSNKSGGPALNLGVSSGKAPIQVNAAAGTAKNLSADELDGKDSDQILPFVRAQRDPTPTATAETISGNMVAANTVEIAAPTEGFLVISGTVQVGLGGGDDIQGFYARARVDDQNTPGVAYVRLNRNASVDQLAEMASIDVTVPVQAGPHAVDFDVERVLGTGNWTLNKNNLNVMFFPQGRGAVTDAGS